MADFTFREYQIESRLTAQYPDKNFNLVYPALGLMGEAGEVAEKIKKHWRSTTCMSAGSMPPEQRELLEKELGDVLWYLAAIATELQVNLGSVASKNLLKLKDRKNRNVICGAGDNR